MSNTSRLDGRPFRVVRYEGQDIAVHLRSFSNDGSVDSADLSLYLNTRVGNMNNLPEDALASAQALRRVLRTQLEARSRALILTIGSIGNDMPRGSSETMIGTREKFEAVLADVLDDADQFSYTDDTESVNKKPMIVTAKRLMASAMDSVDLDVPSDGRKDIADSQYFLAFGSIPTVDGMGVDDLKNVVDELMHRLNLEGNIVRLTQERGQYWLRMNFTVPSARALKNKIVEKDWKNAK